jgi:hypothetical protein
VGRKCIAIAPPERYNSAASPKTGVLTDATTFLQFRKSGEENRVYFRANSLKASEILLFFVNARPI